MGERKRKKVENKAVPLQLTQYYAVGRFRSVRRAMRRGHLTVTGVVLPSRPFHNGKRTKGRKQNELKKKLYGQLREKWRRAS